jgi:hypothetical protein
MTSTLMWTPKAPLPRPWGDDSASKVPAGFGMKGQKSEVFVHFFVHHSAASNTKLAEKISTDGTPNLARWQPWITRSPPPLPPLGPGGPWGGAQMGVSSWPMELPRSRLAAEPKQARSASDRG